MDENQDLTSDAKEEEEEKKKKKKKRACDHEKDDEDCKWTLGEHQRV